MAPNEVSFLIIAIAIMILVIFLIWFLVKAVTTLKNVDQSLLNINALSLDGQQKMKSLQPVFNIIENVGESLEYKTVLLKKEIAIDCLREQINEKTERETDIYVDLIDCALLGVGVWKKLRK